MDKKKHAHEQEAEPAISGDIPASAAGAAAEDRVSELEASLAAKAAEAASNWDKFLRERADLENYRKRTQKEKEELLKYGNESLILEILPAVDNMERALAHASGEEISAIMEGVRLTLSMLISTLKKFGVAPIDTAKGAPFDPALHQAMNQVETAEFPPNSVAEEFQKGYLLNDRLLRPAMVSVAVAPKTGEQ